MLKKFWRKLCEAASSFGELLSALMYLAGLGAIFWPLFASFIFAIIYIITIGPIYAITRLYYWLCSLF